MYQGSDKARPSLQEMTKTQAYKDDKVEVTKVDMRKAENKITKEEQAKMEKIADEMVAEPKTPTGENKIQANEITTSDCIRPSCRARWIYGGCREMVKRYDDKILRFV
jgi:hypothetical protein